MLNRVPMKERRELARKVWEYRKDNGFTQSDLAKRLRLSLRTIQRAEHSKSISIPNFHSLRELVAVNANA